MLRRGVAIVAALFALAGFGLWLAGLRVPGLQLLFLGLGLLICIAIERWRYQKAPRAGAEWRATGERFIDPSSGRHVDVLYDAHSGERRYRTEGEHGPGPG
jgi:hypothetical protein